MNLIEWSNVRRPDDMTAVGGTTTTTAMLTFMGTVHGIPGTFSCGETGGVISGCRAPARYSNDEVALVGDDGSSGTWRFVPDEGGSLYTDDPTYLTLGWWLDKDVAGNPDDFREFALATGLGVDSDQNADGNDRKASRALGNTAGSERGSATYKGAAAGKYAMASTSDDSYEGGHFTAMATLMVDLDANFAATDGTNDRNGVALSGMIDNFMTGDTARADWSVKLMVDGDGMPTSGGTLDLTSGVRNSDGVANTPLASLVGDDTATMTTEWSTGASAKGAGTWTAMFYGGSDVDNIAGVPDAAIGTFNANIGTAARLRGSFGAMKE